MLDEAEARVIAVAEAGAMTLGAARELDQGWFFANVSNLVGSIGLIIHKQTGFPYLLGSAIDPALVLRLYDLGFHASRYDVTIVRMKDRLATLQVLEAIGLGVTEETFEHGTYWKIPRKMRGDEIDAQLEVLPCTFSNVTTYFYAERLQEARNLGVFEFTLSNPQKS